MALVSYGISNSSEDDEDDQSGDPPSPKPMIHSTIPPPKSWSSLPNDVNLLERNRTRPVRILAPSLRQDVGERPKKIVKSTLGSALVSILPEPKHLKNDYVPQVPRCKKNKSPHQNKADTSVESTIDSGRRNSEGSDNGLPLFFFTSMRKDEKESRFAGHHQDYEVTSANQILAYGVHQKVTSEDTDALSSDTELCTPSNQAEGSLRPSSSLNADDLAKLCGSQGKHLTSDGINLIEIDGSKLVNPAEMEMNTVKSLTYDYNSLYRQHKFKSSRRERSKHQITYLVEHAKFFEREVNSYPKNSKISQKRYGF